MMAAKRRQSQREALANLAKNLPEFIRRHEERARRILANARVLDVPDDAEAEAEEQDDGEES